MPELGWISSCSWQYILLNVNMDFKKKEDPSAGATNRMYLFTQQPSSDLGLQMPLLSTWIWAGNLWSHEWDPKTRLLSVEKLLLGRLHLETRLARLLYPTWVSSNLNENVQNISGSVVCCKVLTSDGSSVTAKKKKKRRPNNLYASFPPFINSLFLY